MDRSLRALLAIPLLVVMLLGGMSGYLVTKQLAPKQQDEGVKISVVTLPATPKPSGTPEPSPTDEPRRGGGGGGGSGSCPAGCKCESRPPGGIVIVCGGQ